MKLNWKTKVETRLPSACILAIPMLYVRPLSWWFELKVCVNQSWVCPGSVGTRQALLQGWLLSVCFVCLANVPDLVRWAQTLLYLSLVSVDEIRASIMIVGRTYFPSLSSFIPNKSFVIRYGLMNRWKITRERKNERIEVKRYLVRIASCHFTT